MAQKYPCGGCVDCDKIRMTQGKDEKMAKFRRNLERVKNNYRKRMFAVLNNHLKLR